MDTELQELKSVLRSLVVSSPTQVDVRALLRDYRNMMGAQVPLAKYGYRDPVTFLRERFSDCFVFQGPQNNPVLTLIVPDALKHIDEFVQRQKLSTNVKFKGKRRSIPEQIINKSTKNLIASTFIPPPKNKQYNTTTPKLTTNTATNKNYTTESGKIPLHKSINKLNIQDQALSQESIASNKEISQDNSAEERLQDLNSSQSALQKFLKKRLPFYNSSQHLSSDKYDSGIASSKGDDDSGRRTSSSTGSKAALLEELKKEIRDLVEEHPEGVWCTDLIALYRQRYKRELEFERFGLTSVAALAVGVGGVHVSRAGDGWLLSAAPAPPRRHVPLSVARYAPAAPEQVDPDDALPGIDFDPDVFPQDCMHFMESIPAAPLGALAPGHNVGVMLGEVYSPSHFWLLRLGDGYDAMGDMMDEMTRYYTHGEGKDRSLALGAVRVGHYCSSVFEGDWHRSLIVRVQDCDTVKVRHIDYGTVESVAVSALKPLRRSWAALPAQAVRARLAAVRPPGAGRRWPHAAAAHFLHLVRDRRLVANVAAVDREEDILEVFLIDTSTEEDVCVSSQMVRAGYADPRADSALRTSECYLFPRFDALEAGATPNYAEIHAYLRDGIALDYVDDYRRHVPASLPPPAASPEPGPAGPASPAGPPSPAGPARSASLSADSIDGSRASPEPADPPQLSNCVPLRPQCPPFQPRDPPRAPTPAPTPPPPCDTARTPCESPRASCDASRAPSEAPRAQSDAPRPPNVTPHPRLDAPRAPRAEPRAPRDAAPRPRPPPPGVTPLVHAYSQMLPMPGYAGFPPFPGAVPLYPPVYSPPSPMLFPHPPYSGFCPPHYPGGPFPGPMPAPLPGPAPPRPPDSGATARRPGPAAAPPRPAPLAGPSRPGPSAPDSCPDVSTRSSGAPPESRPRGEPPATPPSSRPPPEAPAAAGAPTPPGWARPRSPPPPYSGAEGPARVGPDAGDVRLSVSECEIFRLLSSVDSNAAHWYMVDAIARAMRTTTTPASALNPAAPEYRPPQPPQAPQPPRAPQPPQAPLPPRPRAPLPAGMRPPPGFGF